jgi:hypothetical protein
MTRYELKTILRQDFLDDTADAPTNDAPYWDGDTLDRYLYLAEREACKRSRLILDASTPAVCAVTLAEGEAEYELHESVLEVEAVTLPDGTPLQRIHRDDLGILWLRTVGTPLVYWVRGRRLGFFPAPGSQYDDLTAGLEVYRLPLGPMAGDTSEPEIPEEHHQDLLYYAAYLALNRRDPDTRNQDGALENLAQFERIFGTIKDAEARERRREQEFNMVVRPC